MKLFIKLFFTILLSFIISGCGSSKPKTDEQAKKDQHICPQCNMPLPKSNINTSKLDENGSTVYFDDVGCMILWAKDNKIDLKNIKAKIFTNDTKKFIDPFQANFTINEKTPMLYGFSAYEKPCKDCIKFGEVIIRMLRGEHMANPKIRKQILGY